MPQSILPKAIDPAQPGCWRRLRAVALGCGGLVAVALVVGLVVAARRPYSRYAIGATLVSLDRFAAGRRVATALVRDHPDENAAFYLLQAAAERNLGDLAAHNRTLDEAVAHFPRSLSANDDRCLYGALFGDPNAALPFCDAAVDLVPVEEASQTRAHRGLARALAGDRAGALDDLRYSVSAWREAGIPDERFARPYARMLEDLEAGRPILDADALAAERSRY